MQERGERVEGIEILLHNVVHMVNSANDLGLIPQLNHHSLTQHGLQEEHQC